MKEIFQRHTGGTVLFLGRLTHFTPQELAHFVEAQGMCYADHYEGQEVALLVLSSMLTPAEEQTSYDLYAAGVPDVTLESFERYYTTHLNPQGLLMSLKLSQDQDRLKRLLGNEAFEDTFFLKLFMLFDWKGEGIHDCDANRDVTISFVKRFFRPDGFRDPAMVYAPTTVMIIAKDSRDPQVLEAILSMPNHEIKISRYEQRKPRNLREAVAFNPAVTSTIIRKLMAYNDRGVDYFLASNPALEAEALTRLYHRADEATKQMMAHNEALPDSLFSMLLEASEEIQKSLLVHQPMSEERIAALLSHPWIEMIGYNPTIAEAVPQLFALEQHALDLALASNTAVSQSYLEKLYLRHGERIAVALAANPNLSAQMAASLYERNTTGVREVLAANPATPKVILQSLCEAEDPQLNRALASNPSVDLYWLRQFQLDTSLVRILAENPTYGNDILRGLGL